MVGSSRHACNAPESGRPFSPGVGGIVWQRWIHGDGLHNPVVGICEGRVFGSHCLSLIDGKRKGTTAARIAEAGRGPSRHRG